MINEVLTEILAAEKQAAVIKAEGEQKAAEIIAESEKTCSEIAAKNAQDVKNAYKATIKEYTEKAEADYKRTMEESVAAGNRLSSDKKSAIDNQAEIICGRLLNGDC